MKYAAVAVSLTTLAWAAHADTPQDMQLRDVSRLAIGKGQAAIVAVIHDRETGCEYLAWEAAYTQGGALVPRMKQDGKQLCRPQ